jgi:hypothetical protein
MSVRSAFFVKAALAAAVVITAGLSALPAKANTYDFNYVTLPDQPFYDIFGMITTDNTLNGGTPNGYDITALTATMIDPNSVQTAISLVPGNAVPPNFINNPSWVVYDNSLIPGTGVTTTGGWLLQSTNSFLYNLWLGNGSFGSVAGFVYLYTNDPNAANSNIPDGPGEPGILTVTQTPLPAALPLFATGLGAMGLFGWRRKRKSAAALAAA